MRRWSVTSLSSFLHGALYHEWNIAKYRNCEFQLEFNYEKYCERGYEYILNGQLRCCKS